MKCRISDVCVGAVAYLQPASEAFSVSSMFVVNSTLFVSPPMKRRSASSPFDTFCFFTFQDLNGVDPGGIREGKHAANSSSLRLELGVYERT